MRSDLRDNTDTINKMIQFGTVKYGIVKQLKDRPRSERDVTSDQEEDRSPIPCSPPVECKLPSPEPQQRTILECSQTAEDHNHNNNSNENIVNHCANSPIKAELNDTYPEIEINHKSSSPVLSTSSAAVVAAAAAAAAAALQQRIGSPSPQNHVNHNQSEREVEEGEEEEEEDHHMSDVGGDESDNDHPNNQSNPEEKAQCKNNDEQNHQENQVSSERGSPPPTLPQFPTAPMTLEAIQNMQIAIAQFAAKTLANGGADNEAAMKQLAFLQQTLFNLQQQQIFQLQLIQQLQSQLAMNQPRDDQENNDEEFDVDGEVDCDAEGDAEGEGADGEAEGETDVVECDVEAKVDCEDRMGSSTESLMVNHKSEESTKFNSDEMDVENHREVGRIDVIKEASEKEENRLNHRLIPKEDSLPLIPKQDENTPLPYGSDLASSIITNHDHPPSLDEPNSLEMLQKRAQEVLDSASQGILAGNLADEFAFGKDKQGDGKNRNEPFFKHRCRYCGKVFGSDSALQIHIRSHTGERPFKCNVCGSRFTTKGNLKVHFQRHAQKFPHVPMNSTPIPEHLDKFHPPLLEQMSPETSPQHQPQMPHPNVPVSLPLPFPPGAGFPGLPLYRPPLEILKTLGPYPNPFFGGLPPMPPKRDQELPTDLRKPVPPPSSPKPKDEIKEEPLSLRIKEEQDTESEAKRPKSTTPPPPAAPQATTTSSSVPPVPAPPPPLLHMPMMPQLPSGTPTHIPPPMSREEMHERLPLNYAKTSPERRSPIRSPASIPRSPFMGPMKPEMTLLPRPHSNDNSWENFIEVSNTSETVKLKELMKNKKLTDPNQCVVCDRVLSCKSALQMHYRTHTGERPFKCRICGRAFTTKGNLKTHMAVHKIRPPMRNFHQCPVCHKKYSNALVLQQHIRLHTGEPTDLTPEQIQAAEIRDFPPSMVPGSFLNPFAFNFGMGAPNGAMGSESSQGDNDDAMDCSDDFDDEDISDHLSNGGDSDRPKSRDEMKGMLFEQKLKIENNRPKSEASTSSAPTSPVSAMNKSSPAPSDSSQGALDLTPRAIIPPPNMNLMPTRPPFGMFPNLPLFPSVSSSTQNMCNAMNSIAQSVMPSAPFNPLALSGVRGSTTCGICFKTFPCHSALEIHYRSHTKERPFKCSICDRGFTTKGNLKQHMLTHKIRDMEQDAFRNRAVKYMSNWKEGFE